MGHVDREGRTENENHQFHQLALPLLLSPSNRDATEHHENVFVPLG